MELRWLITGIAALIAVIRKDRSTFLIWFLNTAGTMVLILYQLYSGRILYRTIIICLLPSYIIYMTIFIKWISKQKKTMYILSIIMILFCIPLAGRSITLAFDAGEKEEVLNDEIIDNTLKQYVIGHADNVYIKQTGMTSNRSPNGVLSNGKASNIIGWGGSGSYSKVNRIQLRANGIKNFTGSVFKNNNTFFVSATNIVGKNNKGKKVKETNKLVLIFTWLKQKYGARGIVQEDTVCDGIYVYRFLFETPEKDEDVYDYMNGRFVLIN